MGFYRKACLIVLPCLLVLAGSGYYFLFLDSPSAIEGGFEVDLERARDLALSEDGARATSIEVEKVASVSFPRAAVIIGGGWSPHEIPIYSFRLNGPDWNIIIDTAVDEHLSRELSGDAVFNPKSYARMISAMSEADQIVLTHEHMDHIGGLTTYEDIPALHDALRLTPEQLAEPQRADPAVITEELNAAPPLVYDDMTVIAPGVVLIKAPGHSPGSQMVYVVMDNGEEFMFVGDIGWSMHNIDEAQGRPLLVSLLILNEERQTVRTQLTSLRELNRSEPELNFVVAHDGRQIDQYIANGTMIAQFGVE